MTNSLFTLQTQANIVLGVLPKDSSLLYHAVLVWMGNEWTRMGKTAALTTHSHTHPNTKDIYMYMQIHYVHIFIHLSNVYIHTYTSIYTNV